MDVIIHCSIIPHSASLHVVSMSLKNNNIGVSYVQEHEVREKPRICPVPDKICNASIACDTCSLNVATNMITRIEEKWVVKVGDKYWLCRLGINMFRDSPHQVDHFNEETAKNWARYVRGVQARGKLPEGEIKAIPIKITTIIEEVKEDDAENKGL